MSETQQRIKCKHNSYLTLHTYIGKPFRDIECQMCMATGRAYDNGQIKWKDDQYVERLYTPVNKSLVGRTFQKLGIRK